MTASTLFYDVLRNSFLKKQDFEIMDVQKSTIDSHAFIMAPTPKQAEKIRLHHVAANQEIIMPQKKISQTPRITPEAKAKKDALSLTLSHLPILMSVVDTTEAIYKTMESKNVASIWFHREVGTRHNGSANVQCTNPIVYRSFVNKTHVIGGHYVDFAPHRRSLDGLDPPTKEQVEKWGFNDINAALVNTVATLVTTTPTITKEDVLTIMEESNKTIREENKKMKEEIEKTMEKKMNEERLINNAKHDELQEKIDHIYDILMLTVKGIQEIKSSTSRPTLEYQKNVD